MSCTPRDVLRPPPALTLLGAGAVGVGPGVGGVFGVSGGGALLGPVEVVRVVLREEADVAVLKAAVELSCQPSKRAEV